MPRKRSFASQHRSIMPRMVLVVVALMAASLMVGNELTVARFLHSTLTMPSENVHSEAVKASSFSRGLALLDPGDRLAFLCLMSDSWGGAGP